MLDSVTKELDTIKFGKKELMLLYCEDYPTGQKEASELIHNVVLTIQKAIGQGKNVSIQGLGQFFFRNSAPCTRIDINSGEYKTTPERITTVFKMSKSLRHIHPLNETTSY